MYKTAIIGAGVVGAMTARRLAAYDMNLVILEKEEDVAMGQSKANSGIVHASTSLSRTDMSLSTSAK